MPSDYWYHSTAFRSWHGFPLQNIAVGSESGIATLHCIWASGRIAWCFHKLHAKCRRVRADISRWALGSMFREADDGDIRAAAQEEPEFQEEESESVGNNSGSYRSIVS